MHLIDNRPDLHQLLAQSEAREHARINETLSPSNLVGITRFEAASLVIIVACIGFFIGAGI